MATYLPEDFGNRDFYYTEFFQANGALTTENVMDYFLTSIFSDPRSNNAMLRMQTRHLGMPIDNEEEQLKRLTGIEFAVTLSMPPDLFIIQKRERSGPEQFRVVASFHVMNGRIYCSPDIYSLLSNQLRNSVQLIQSSLEVARSYRPKFTPRTGHTWELTGKPEKRQQDTDTDAPAAETEQSGSSGPKITPKLASGKPDPKKMVMPAMDEFISLKRAMESMYFYVGQQMTTSAIPTIDVEPEQGFAAADAAHPGHAFGTATPGTTTIGGTVGGGHTTTAAASSNSYTPAGIGGTGTSALRSVSMSVPGGGPGTPAGAASPAPPGAPGAGKKKRRRQAAVALKARASPELGPSPGGPQSPMEL